MIFMIHPSSACSGSGRSIDGHHAMANQVAGGEDELSKVTAFGIDELGKGAVAIPHRIRCRDTDKMPGESLRQCFRCVSSHLDVDGPNFKSIVIGYLLKLTMLGKGQAQVGCFFQVSRSGEHLWTALDILPEGQEVTAGDLTAIPQGVTLAHRQLIAFANLPRKQSDCQIVAWQPRPVDADTHLRLQQLLKMCMPVRVSNRMEAPKKPSQFLSDQTVVYIVDKRQARLISNCRPPAGGLTISVEDRFSECSGCTCVSIGFEPLSKS